MRLCNCVECPLQVADQGRVADAEHPCDHENLLWRARGHVPFSCCEIIQDSQLRHEQGRGKAIDQDLVFMSG